MFIGLSILGIKFAAILGLVAGLFGLVPIIGPLLGGGARSAGHAGKLSRSDRMGGAGLRSSFSSSKTTSSRRAYRAAPSG